MIPETTDTPLKADCPSAPCSEFAWARYNDATVNAMLRGNACHTEIIAVLAREKADLIKRIVELEMIAPKKITMPDGSVMVYRAPAHLLPNANVDLPPRTSPQNKQDAYGG